VRPTPAGRIGETCQTARRRQADDSGWEEDEAHLGVVLRIVLGLVEVALYGLAASAVAMTAWNFVADRTTKAAGWLGTFLSASSAGSRICLSVLTHDDGDSTKTAREVHSMHDHNAIPAGSPSDEDAQPAPSHSMWWMVACCAPMVLIALALLLGVFGPR
jgi:hypothetical protein